LHNNDFDLAAISAISNPTQEECVMGKRRDGLAAKRERQGDSREAANRLDELERRCAAITASALPPPTAGPPMAMTGAVMPVSSADPLRDLNRLLAIDDEITGVLDTLDRRTSRRRGVARWWVLLATVRGVEWQTPIQSSADVRRPEWLNNWADYWGRDEELPLLTAEDGRRMLRLLHEVVEANQANTTNTPTQKVNK